MWLCRVGLLTIERGGGMQNKACKRQERSLFFSLRRSEKLRKLYNQFFLFYGFKTARKEEKGKEEKKKRRKEEKKKRRKEKKKKRRGKERKKRTRKQKNPF